ncbi:MAG: hypothetical protein IPJ56_09000 [Gemmatimonadetes bacterium]|nr:hypothetical protein [Gemmatimonadota bacterium]
MLVSTSTGLAAGTYCDVLGGGKVGAGCAGASVVVGTSGGVALSLAGNSALVIDVTTKL